MVRVFKDKGKVAEEMVGAMLRFLEENQRVAVSKVEKRLLSPLSRISNKLELLLENSALGQMELLRVQYSYVRSRLQSNQSTKLVANCRRLAGDGLCSRCVPSPIRWRRLVAVAKSNGHALNGDGKNAVATPSPLVFCDGRMAFGNGIVPWLTELIFVVIDGDGKSDYPTAPLIYGTWKGTMPYITYKLTAHNHVP
ncbi:hypothetical protein ACLB2K_047664 [Fragaria x ananassa]